MNDTDIDPSSLAPAHPPDLIKHNIEKYRRHLLPVIRHYIPKGKSLLDYGCGSGEMVAVAKEGGYRVAGLDPSHKAIDMARGLLGSSCRLYISASDIEEKFDAILCISVLQYSTNPQKTLQKIRSLLKPGGLLIIGYPNYNSLYQFLTRQQFPKKWCVLPSIEGAIKITSHIGISDYIYSSSKKTVTKHIVFAIEKFFWLLKIDISYQKLDIFKFTE